jgi:ribosomal protein L5
VPWNVSGNKCVKTFRLRKEEITGGWKKLRSEKVHNFLSSPHIITVIKSRRMDRWGTEEKINTKF